MNPAGQGNASGLTVACTFVSGTAAGFTFTMEDAYDATSGGLGPASGALYHYGAARNVSVVASRTGAAPGTLSPNNVITSCATNNTAAAVVSAACPAPGGAAGNLAFSAADINRSVEFALSTPALGGEFINPGTYITCVGATCTPALAATKAKLSKPLIATGAPLCPASDPSPCTATVSAAVLVSNGTNRATVDGVTANGSATVTSATAHFCGAPGATTGACAGVQTDVGARVSSGDLPDGATIATVNSTTSVTLACTGCLAGFAGVTAGSGLALNIDPKSPPTSTRYVTDVTTGGAGGRTLTSASATFNNTDIGLKVVFSTPAGALPGARIGSVPNATTAVLVGSGAATVPAGVNRVITIGVPTKTAPANGDVVGTLAIALTVNPLVSATSPPCGAGKVSGFHIPWQWKNPGAYGLANNGTTHVEGHPTLPGTSIAQLIFNTASTSFAGFIVQNVSVTAGVPTTSDYLFKIVYAPIAVGVCPGTPIAETLSFIGISVKQAQNPTFTGGGGGGTRALGPIPDGQTVTYTGGTGVNVVTGGSDPVDTNSCTVSSPNVIQIGC